MIIYRKPYEELTRDELFEILKARQEVFIKEQQCVYCDIDDIDKKSTHVYGVAEGKLAAYLRTFPRPEESGVIQIGRVLTTVRKRGYGKEILDYALKSIPEKRLCLEAQVYAIGFYEAFGFRVVSEPFDEDGIPHVKMRLERD